MEAGKIIELLKKLEAGKEIGKLYPCGVLKVDGMSIELCVWTSPDEFRQFGDDRLIRIYNGTSIKFDPLADGIEYLEELTGRETA